MADEPFSIPPFLLRPTVGGDPALTAYVAVLRTALTRLVEETHMLKALPGHWCASTEEAEEVLRLETGREAQADLDILEKVCAEVYTLADWCHTQLTGKPRSPSGYIPTTAEVWGSLAEIEQLTARSLLRAGSERGVAPW